MKYIPNFITLSRILAIPFILAGIFFTNNTYSYVVFFVYTYASITDFLDGYLARKYDFVSVLGRITDPIADKILVATTILVILVNQEENIAKIATIPCAIILFREFSISGLREFLGQKNIVIHVSKLAKIKTFLQIVALGMFLIPKQLMLTLQAKILFLDLQMVYIFFLWAVAFITLVTAIDYILQSITKLKKDV